MYLDDLMKSITILMQGRIRDTMCLYSILLALGRKNHSLFLINVPPRPLIEKHLSNKKLEYFNEGHHF
jgi:hypothetical protein